MKIVGRCILIILNEKKILDCFFGLVVYNICGLLVYNICKWEVLGRERG